MADQFEEAAMPRLWIFSDLHQDRGPNAWDPARHAPADGFDVVVAAGDLHSPLTAAVDWLADRFAGCRVIYVPGNHDFWVDGAGDPYTFDDQIQRGRDVAARRGVDLLMDDAVEIAGARFVGATLWTDMRVGTYSPSHAFATARRWMYDYRRIRRRPTGRHKYVRPMDTVMMHRASRAFLDSTLAAPFDGPSVVVTHHAPHPASLWDPHADLRWCYASDLSDLIHARAPDLWVHGHVHARRDYRLGATRIVCNPRGHVGEDCLREFDPAFVIDMTNADVAAGGDR
jgi:3',5'-cyclic AMP phosphodiesterase CpdA